MGMNDRLDAKKPRKKASAVRKPDSANTGQGKPKVQWQGYVNYSQDRVDKNVAQQYLETPGWYAKAVFDAITTGYKLSVVWDSYWDCFSASLFCQDSESSNAGWCLTARADDPELAMFRVLFVHFVCLQGQWRADAQSTGYNPDHW